MSVLHVYVLVHAQYDEDAVVVMAPGAARGFGWPASC